MIFISINVSYWENGAWDPILSPRACDCFWILSDFSFFTNFLNCVEQKQIFFKRWRFKHKKITCYINGRVNKEKQSLWTLTIDSWGHKESDTTERLNWTELNLYHINLQGRLETGSKLAIMYWILVAEIKGRIFVSMGTDPLLYFSKCQGYIWKVIAIFSHFIKIIPCLYFTHKNLWLKKVCLHSSKMGFPGGTSGRNKTKQNKTKTCLLM